MCHHRNEIELNSSLLEYELHLERPFKEEGMERRERNSFVVEKPGRHQLGQVIKINIINDVTSIVCIILCWEFIKQNSCERGFMQKPWCYRSLISFISYIQSFKESCYITFKIYQKLQIIITCTTTTVLYAHIIVIAFKWPPCFHPWLLPFMSTSSQNDIPKFVR